MWFFKSKQQKRAALRRKLVKEKKAKAEQLAALEEKKLSEEELIQMANDIVDMRKKAMVAISRLLAEVRTYYSGSHSDIRNIHERINNIIELSGSAAFNRKQDLSFLVKEILWLATVLPSSNTILVSHAIELLEQYRGLMRSRGGMVCY